MIALNWLICLSALALAGCAPDARRDPPRATAVLAPRATPVLDTPVPSPLPAQPTVPLPTATPGCALEQGAAVRYTITATLDWALMTVRARQEVRFRNETEHALDRIVFTVEQEPFTLRGVTSGGAPVVGYGREGASFVAPLAAPLLPGCEVALTLDYDLAVPAIQDGYRVGRLGYWGHSARQVNLGMGFPLVVPYDHGVWLTPTQHDVGEYYALREADFTVELEVKGAPAGVRATGPGTATALGDRRWRFELAGAREIAISVGAFNMLRDETDDGTAVELYYFVDGTNAPNAPHHALQTAAAALTLFERVYGPYPHERLVVVQGDFPDGMEFSGLVFVSDDWFRTWTGAPNDWLTLITAHEVAHQWWYALVGSDQGRYPYLDEALAMYSEVLFFEEYYPDLLPWWWDFRVALYSPAGYVDQPIYDFHSPRAYINAVYLRGAQMLGALRRELSDEAFFGWLRAYCQQMHGQIARPADFWGALTDDQYAATAAIRAAYLRQGDVLGAPEDESIP